MTKEGIVLAAVGGFVGLSLLGTGIWMLGPVRLLNGWLAELKKSDSFWVSFYKLWLYTFTKDPANKHRNLWGASGVTQVEGIPDIRGWPDIPSHKPVIRLRENDFIDLSTPVEERWKPIASDEEVCAPVRPYDPKRAEAEMMEVIVGKHCPYENAQIPLDGLDGRAVDQWHAIYEGFAQLTRDYEGIDRIIEHWMPYAIAEDKKYRELHNRPKGYFNAVGMARHCLFREREAHEAEGYRFQYPEKSKGPEMVRKDLKASGQEPKKEEKKDNPLVNAALYGIIVLQVAGLTRLLFFS